MDSSRRKFLQLAGVAAVTASVGGRTTEAEAAEGSAAPSPDAMPMRTFGKTGVKVSAIGVGGFHIGKPKDEQVGIRIIQEALDAGINFMDNAWDYHQGRSEEIMGKALEGRRDKAFLMTKVCTHGRDKNVAMKQLEDSLRRLRTDHLDLWQIHEVAYANDPELHFQKGGVVEALEQAKKQGKVRFVGFTGHKHPELHLRMLKHGFPFDSVQMPLNVFDGSFRSFEREVLPLVLQRKMAPLGMKSLTGNANPVKQGVVTAQEAIRYAMSLPVAVTITGIDSPDILQQNLAIARGFKPMTKEEMAALRNRVAPLAADGRFELFKTTAVYEGNEGRQQHGFPPQGEMQG
ncbi:aldo/keto reductase [Archangium violaceum]|uniref:Aldo/keto reductase n=1 Tax=Archangium violaceum Cb vi76 TaxID=1406225 RepID=A0A084SP77_9BACT|nr:aldo/keto reductase [Archangium violaceum]KFA90262.1 aldo/keto reductase [Archangium violaceum Cb vi76]